MGSVNSVKRARGRLSAVVAVVILFAGLTAAPAMAENFLWLIEGSGGKAWLTGSVHLARPDMYPLDPAFDKAFDQCEALALEADISKVDEQAMQAWFMTEGVYPEGDHIKNHLSDETAGLLAEAGVPIEALGRFKPWLVAVTLEIQKLQALGFDTEYGLDKHFLSKAKINNMPIAELESIQFQLDLFNNLDEKEQDLFLRYTLIELATIEKQMNELISAWKNGQDGKFYDVFFENLGEEPELRVILDKIIFDRNKGMADKIEGYIQSGKPYFVVIGAGHVSGPEGVLERLREKGLRVTQQ